MSRLTEEDILSVPGAFWQPDIDMFQVLLEATAAKGPGDLAELGVLYGRSAVLIGDHLRDGETFTVVDLFGQPAEDESNAQENGSSYADLSQSVFEENYRQHHRVLPTIVQGLSHTIAERAAAGTHRFVHVDASHLFEHVESDIRTARQLLTSDGVLVLDDFREEHTPGVAAAAWQAVIAEGLRPFALSPRKMYATWGDGDACRSALVEWARARDHPYEVQQINGLHVLRVWTRRKAPHPARRYVPEVAWPLLNRARRTLRRHR